MEHNKPTRFIRDILIPSYGPSSIPDDKVRRHVLRQEPITFNIKANKTGKGAFILFPNNPGSVIGAHLYYSDDAKGYRFDQAITAAQNLRKSYNLARQTGFVLTIRSSTLPSGVYALSGTFNAATYEGPPSELSDGTSLIPEYGSLLQVTANPQDKLGNVKVGEGLTVLGLPVSWDQPYTRLSDEIASSNSTGGAYVIDDTMSLNYTTGPGEYTMKGEGKMSNQLAEVARFNFDSNQQSIIDAHMAVKPILMEPSANIYKFTALVSVTLVGLDGVDIQQSQVDRTLEFTIQPGESVATKYADLDMVYPMLDTIDSQKVAGAVSVKILVQSDYTAPSGSMSASSPDATPWQMQVADIRINAKAINGNLPGVTSPTTVVLYEGMPEGATLTGTGVKNYELIPNQDLLRNVQTTYPKMDPKGLAYAKAIFAHREDLQIRSVWSTPDYESRFNLFSEISMISVTNIPVEETQAMAWGLSDVIRTVRKFVPVLSSVADVFLPGSGGLIRGAEDLAQKYLGDAASGRLIGANAASGRLIGPPAPMTKVMFGQRDSFAADGKIPRLRGNGAKLFLSDYALLKANGLSRKEQTSIMINPADPLAPEYAVIFPTVVTTNTPFHERQITGTQLYAILPGDHREALDILGTYKKGDLKVYGIIEPGEWKDPVTGTYTVVPLRNIMGNTLVIDPTAPLPRGSSMQLALSLAASKMVKGLIPVAFTGAMGPDGKIQPNQWSHIKKLGMDGYNIPLASNDSSSDVKVRNLNEAVSIAASYSTNYDRAHSFPKHEGRYTFAAESWADRLHYLFEEAIAQNPRFAKIRDVVIYLGSVDDRDHTILDGLWDYTQGNPDGRTLHNLVVNSLAPAKPRRGNTSEENMLRRARTIAERLNDQGIPVDENWVLSNGNRGMTTEQVKQYYDTGVIPTPVNTRSTAVRAPENPEQVADRVFNNSFANAKKIPEQEKGRIRQELLDIANTRSINENDIRAIRERYVRKGTDHLKQPTRGGMRRVPIPARVVVEELGDYDLPPPPPEAYMTQPAPPAQTVIVTPARRSRFRDVGGALE